MDMRRLHDETGQAPAISAPLGLREHLVLSVLWFAQNVQSAALLPIVIPIQITLFVDPGEVGAASQATTLGWIATVGALLAMALPPIVGALSDRTTGPWGRRRPYIGLGVALLLLGGWLLAAPHGLLGLLVGLLIFTMGGNIATAGYQGLLPDQTPASQRGAASGYMGIMTILGNAGSLGLAAFLLGSIGSGVAASDAIQHGVLVYFVVSGGVLAIGALITILGVHERPLLVASAPSLGQHIRSPFARFSAMWLAPWGHFRFRWVFLTRFSVMLGLSLFMTFIEYYFATVAHIPNFVQATAALALLALAGAACSALVLGLLSDRIGRVPLVFGASMCMALAALAFVVLPQGAPLWPLGLLFGVGYGAYTSVDWALAVDVLPSPDAAGKDMGLWSIATALPAIVAPLVGTVVIGIAGNMNQTTLGYRVVFAVAVATLAAGGVFILRIPDARHPTAPAHRRPGVGWRLAAGTGGGRARGFLRFWPVWERFWQWTHPAVRIPGAPHDLFLLEMSHYHGPMVELPGGARIQPGDRIGELHLHNAVLTSVASRVPPWTLLRMLAQDMRALARWSQGAVFPAEIRAIHAVTLLGSGAARLGFTVRERPRAIHAWFERFFLTGLLALYSPQGRARLEHGATYGSYPVEVWMLRDELQRRYGGLPQETGAD